MSAKIEAELRTMMGRTLDILEREAIIENIVVQPGGQAFTATINGEHALIQARQISLVAALLKYGTLKTERQSEIQ